MTSSAYPGIDTSKIPHLVCNTDNLEQESKLTPLEICMVILNTLQDHNLQFEA